MYALTLHWVPLLRSSTPRPRFFPLASPALGGGPAFLGNAKKGIRPDFSFPLFSVTQFNYSNSCAKRAIMKARTNEHYCNIRPPKS